ncbi:GAF domain-containing protein [Micromonospora sp. M71_S20]|uniref:GAF and ANTAR domain-containing protein n=1 Tax=Micromonospora sp. M71_S20 TaxID=592872 RepID=UPI000EAD4DF6|nr:GAF and ANTAR domain-containing protein [Micromonospora sp. M71_S20]RLK26170.1 GAF domain-containing protein [Micromonospora sp. M71_S20]
MEQSPLDPREALAELGRIRLGEASLEAVMSQIAALARRGVPGAEDVSVTLLRGEAPQSLAYTSAMARELDEWQYAHGGGPCLDASVSGGVLSLPDMATENRWPAWAAEARDRGVHSSLSMGLPIQEAVVGTLNVYGTRPHAFDPEGIELAKTFAAYAAVALANAHLYESTTTLARQMRTAMESRAVIEQAKGIIMGERRCTPEEAFALLSKVSQDSNRKVRDVAAALVDRAIGRQP